MESSLIRMESLEFNMLIFFHDIMKNCLHSTWKFDIGNQILHIFVELVICIANLHLFQSVPIVVTYTLWHISQLCQQSACTHCKHVTNARCQVMNGPLNFHCSCHEKFWVEVKLPSLADPTVGGGGGGARNTIKHKSTGISINKYLKLTIHLVQKLYSCWVTHLTNCLNSCVMYFNQYRSKARPLKSKTWFQLSQSTKLF